MGPKTTWFAFVLALVCRSTGSADPLLPWQGPRVIVIGVDGLSVDAVTAARMLRLRALMDRSAWTLEARGVIPTLSSPNWASAINGASPAQHGITSNGWLRHMVEFQPVCRAADGKFPTIFGVLRAAYPNRKIAVFHDWGGFSDLLEKDAPTVMRHEHGPAKTTAAAIEYWRKNRPALTFIHLDNVDHQGHAHGWYSKEYYRAAEEADGYIGQVLDMLDSLAARESTYVLVTSDHGGTAHGHGKNSLAEIQIPWILSGPGIARGRVTALVNTFDTALTVAWIFNLDTPQCWIGRPVLTAFGPALMAAHRAAAGANLSPRDCGAGGRLAGVNLQMPTSLVP